MTFAGALTILGAPTHAHGDPTLFEPSENVSVLGHKLGAEFLAGTLDTTRQVRSAANLSILGSILQALQATIDAPLTPQGSAYTEIYSFGFRVFSKSFYFKDNGILQAEVGFAPTQINVPFIVYPVGPITFQIDGGVRFQADLQEQIMPTIILPSTELSSLTVQLKGNVLGAGFIEGSAEALVIRAGVGGQLDLLDGQADVQSEFFFNGNGPRVQLSGLAEFLNGKFYAFADFFDIFRWGWKRFWEDDLFNWKGYCFSAGALSCPAR